MKNVYIQGGITKRTLLERKNFTFIMCVLILCGVTNLAASGSVPNIQASAVKSNGHSSQIITNQGSVLTTTTSTSCNNTGSGQVLVSKIVTGSPSNTNTALLPFTITATDNGQNIISATITQATSPKSICISVGHTFSITENGFPSGFTFSTPTYNGCTGTVSSQGQSFACTITNTLLNGGTATPQGSIISPSGTITTVPGSSTATLVNTPTLNAQGQIIISSENTTGLLKVITHNVNNCQPKASCADLVSSLPYVDVHQFVNNVYSTLSSFPGSELGRTVSFFVLGPGAQYDVSQTQRPVPSFVNVKTNATSDCEGVIHQNENKVCTITNLFSSVPAVAEAVGLLKVITHNVNNCQPQASCADLVSSRPAVDVNKFVDNQYSLVSIFPGSEIGRTLSFCCQDIFNPLGLQYDISQERLSFPASANVTTNATSDCEGVLHVNENKVCTITNLITNLAASHNTTATSLKQSPG